eukprot:jgi/Chlat1/8472/Chrsp80S07864
MASGFGVKGGKGRCYGLWMEFSGCMASCETPGQCRDLREDYLECLHHRKEFQRINTINLEAEKQFEERKKQIFDELKEKWRNKYR